MARFTIEPSTKGRSPKKTKSPLEWLAGANKPDGRGYVAIDPQRWAAMVREMDKAERDRARAK